MTASEKKKRLFVEIQQFSNCFVSQNGTMCPVGHNMISKTVVCIKANQSLISVETIQPLLSVLKYHLRGPPSRAWSRNFFC